MEPFLHLLVIFKTIKFNIYFDLGITKNIFEKKKVKKLEYESYDKMAYSELRKICIKIREKYSTLKNVIIIHRIGYLI